MSQVREFDTGALLQVLSVTEKSDPSFALRSLTNQSHPDITYTLKNTAGQNRAELDLLSATACFKSGVRLPKTKVIS